MRKRSRDHPDCPRKTWPLLVRVSCRKHLRFRRHRDVQIRIFGSFSMRFGISWWKNQLQPHFLLNFAPWRGGDDLWSIRGLPDWTYRVSFANYINALGEVSLYGWPPVYFVWNQLICLWWIKRVLLVWSNPNQSNRRSAVQWFFPIWWVFYGTFYLLASNLCVKELWHNWQTVPEIRRGTSLVIGHFYANKRWAKE